MTEDPSSSSEKKDANKSNAAAYSPAQIETAARAFWKERDIFKKSMANRKKTGAKPYIFLEGPPTANGKPHIGNIFTRAVKDSVLRYKTMQGYYIERKAGWDTHGLPVEIEVEKELGLKNKAEIESYGIEAFNRRCRESVFKYEKEWRKATEDIGFWIDMDHPYITMKNEYIESVWWSLQQMWKKGLLYKGYKVTPYCPRCGTSLSSHEVALGYKDVEEPSIFLKFKLKDFADTYVLAWTTTPWTLISNVALAVHPDYDYVQIETTGGERLIFAERLLGDVLGSGVPYTILNRYKGRELEGKAYEPPFTYCVPTKKAHVIILADFVTLEEGTGVVHIAPAFGEDDYNASRKYDLPVIQPVDLSGKFTDEVADLKGLFVKDADQKIIRMLDERGILFKQKSYRHSYPFCWRCDTPLLYYARESWFVKMTAIKDALVANNENISWFPPYLKHGRFGDFLENVIDWALSRDRYWGTPLPVWTCKSCGHQHCVGSIDELRTMSIYPLKEEEIDLHKPYIDNVFLKCPNCSQAMMRELNVIDCWYDSGSAFFAQFHYPFENKELFKKNFPVDFISEGIDQTRGWFYSLHAIASTVFGTNAYKSCLTVELVMDEKGQKMSKSRGNVVNPGDVINEVGVDALRWYLLSNNAPWQPIKFDMKALKETSNKHLLTIWNVLSFFTTYADLDKFNAADRSLLPKQRSVLDRWLLSQMQSTVKSIDEAMEKMELHKAMRAIEEFVFSDLSNWYVRRSRRRFWLEEWTEDKKSAYTTLYEVLITLSQCIAPFAPYLAEEMYQRLLAYASDEYLKQRRLLESVHLCDYPVVQTPMLDEALSESMALARRIVELGRSARVKAGIKTRWPLSRAYVICPDETFKTIAQLIDVLKEEINVKSIEHALDSAEFQNTVMKPNLAHLGKTFRAKAGAIAEKISAMTADEVLKGFESGEAITIDVGGETVELTKDDVIFETSEKENVTLASEDGLALALDVKITDELKAEAMVRELIRRIQEMRKIINFKLDDFVETTIQVSDDVKALVESQKALIAGETRSKTLVFADVTASEDAHTLVREWPIDGITATISVRKAD